tara:strand:+ start:272 stop:676 length:405 start_codon:yes stop_codon:yes gene_type:complete
MNKILILHTSWYEKYISQMTDVAQYVFEKSYKVEVSKAPGSIELASLAKHKIMNNNYLGIFFNGIIIRGETNHYDLISSETFRSIGNLALEHSNLAIINNVICVENENQLNERLVKNTRNNAESLIALINEKSL